MQTALSRRRLRHVQMRYLIRDPVIASDTYQRLLQDLGSNSAFARAGAVVGITPFAFEDQADRGAQTITILVTQLTVETDFRVQNVLIPALAKIGKPAIVEVARANK